MTQYDANKVHLRCMEDQWINVAEYEKFIDMTSGSRLKLAFWKLALVEFWWGIKEENL